MADRGSYGVAGPRLDLQQLQLEAQHRWLRPAEICEILRNYKSFIITKEPPNRPPSGSLFLFDRKVLRYFRKDGHNWRKKKDGKTVKEAHEKLKVGSVDVLHCYYAHGEDNESFQRRSYWMLEPDMMHIVFVHYLEVKGSKTNMGANRDIDEAASVSRNGSSMVSGAVPSGSTDSMSPTSTLTSLCEDADSGDIHQVGSTVNSIHVLPYHGNGHMDKLGPGLQNSYLVHPSPDHFTQVQGNKSRASHGSTTIANQISNGLAPWNKVVGQRPAEFHKDPSFVPSSSQPVSMENILGEENYVIGDLLMGKNALAEEGTSSLPIQSSWQIPEETQRNVPKWPISQLLSSELGPDFDMDLFEQRLGDGSLELSPQLFNVPGHLNEPPGEKNYSAVLENSQLKYSENLVPGEQNIGHVLNVKRSLLDAEESLKKVDSFSRWISKELGEVDDLQMQSSSGLSWVTVDCGNVIDDSSLSPSLSKDQLFSITDFWPKWTSADSETEVIITGKFLKGPQEVANYKWSCMFGEMEVPAEVLADGVLSCRVPAHKEGRVPFYMTCSNRLACSEVREFDYQEGSSNKIEIEDVYGNSVRDMMLHFRLERLLSQKSGVRSNYVRGDNSENRGIISKLISLKEEEEFSQNEESAQEMDLFHKRVKELILQKQLKEKLYAWLINRVSEDGKGPCVLDRDGQGVLHLVAALGYDWAIAPIIRAGVSINFRDVNGWTALHWAASSGREKTVAVLVSLGAAPGLFTDPSPENKLGRTPADLAAGNGHKGMSGLLAEFSLVTHLSSLAVDDCREDASQEASRLKAVQTISERTPTPGIYGDVAEELSLKDSLTAVLNATQAADRIHQVYRMQSFQRKQLTEFENDELGILDQYAISLLASKEGRAGQGDIAHAAATNIQKKFRGWKKRKEFLIIRQRIVKIQAHVRGHQVRKKYKSVVWSVGILEKVILRWRRKGSGLRGFRPEATSKDQNQPQMLPSREDDYDFLKDGRKQTEERLQKALSRVKSMVQYPEARAQYRRLLTVVEGFRENKGGNMDLINSEETVDGVEDLIDIDLLLDDDHFMPLAFN